MRKVLGRVWNALRPGALILSYHRIADLENDPLELAVSPEHFSEQLEVIRRLGTVTSLDDLLRAHGSGKIPRRSIVLTFDDGYRDNLTSAKPALERHDLPATFFVTAGNLDSTREYWWDEIEALLTNREPLPPVIEVSIRGRTERLERIGDRSIYDQAISLLRPLMQSEQQKAVAEITDSLGAELPTRDTHRTLTAEDLSHLANGALAAIGSHSLTHVDLSKCEPAIQEKEILEGKKLLEEIMGKRVNHFAYPYGTFDSETISIVRRARFTSGCSAIETPLRRSSDRYLIPRMRVPDCDGARFEHWLSRCFQS